MFNIYSLRIFANSEYHLSGLIERFQMSYKTWLLDIRWPSWQLSKYWMRAHAYTKYGSRPGYIAWGWKPSAIYPGRGRDNLTAFAFTNQIGKKNQNKCKHIILNNESSSYQSCVTCVYYLQLILWQLSQHSFRILLLAQKQSSAWIRSLQ